MRRTFRTIRDKQVLSPNRMYCKKIGAKGTKVLIMVHRSLLTNSKTNISDITSMPKPKNHSTVINTSNSSSPNTKVRITIRKINSRINIVKNRKINLWFVKFSLTSYLVIIATMARWI